MCMDGQLWYNLYRKKWSDGRKLVSQNDLATKAMESFCIFLFTLSFLFLYNSWIQFHLPKIGMESTSNVLLQMLVYVKK